MIRTTSPSVKGENLTYFFLKNNAYFPLKKYCERPLMARSKGKMNFKSILTYSSQTSSLKGCLNNITGLQRSNNAFCQSSTTFPQTNVAVGIQSSWPFISLPQQFVITKAGQSVPEKEMSFQNIMGKKKRSESNFVLSKL